MSRRLYTLFKCPKVDCKTFYNVLHELEPPEQAPRCLVCSTPFLAKDGADYLRYQPIHLALSDQSPLAKQRELSGMSQKVSSAREPT